ncbi:alcohol dehydrogenase [Sorangium cellulosum]|jgi:threonine dehydrogenase-like Zn-dependent dehydrogenase|uniref:Alcohol dehydrogenase n=1 Tax=Sorangium cellulosum TaxID=56 RepID=A0A4P2Q9T8_SORCE|nr:alcohol dehydrogenase [Sorangium cellulosum]
MKALVFHSPKHVSVDTIDTPVLEQATDAIVRVTSTAICGSDLHIYNGLFPQTRPLVLGHEFMGIVEEVGSDVRKLRPGDRVVVPFAVACGSCFFCERNLPGHCERSNPGHYGPEGNVISSKGGGLFGYTDLYGGYAGGQAEYVRVPYADTGPRKVGAELTDEQVLFLTDILPTGYTAIDWAGVRGGETVAVIGCGPVGIMAMKCAWLRGAARVIGVDREEYRLERAREIASVETVNVESGVALEFIRAATDGRGADACIDAVGMEAHRTPLVKISNLVHGQLGSFVAFKLAVSAVRRGGIVSVVGVYGVPYDNFPLGQLFDKGVTVRFGQAPVHKYVDQLLMWIKEGKLRADDVITHRLPLAEAPRGYDIFNTKKDGCVKVVLKP